jgi:exopolysaccharide production protein ExoQ
MTPLYPEPQFVTAPMARASTIRTAYRPSREMAGAHRPVSQEILSWLLFWPLLFLIARHSVYFAGPARTAEAYQYGAMGGQGGSHYDIYVILLFLLGFVIAGCRRVLVVLRNNLVIPTMLALAVCSALWSPVPRITLQMCIHIGLSTLFACYLSARYTAERLMQLLIFMGLYSALLCVLFSLALPKYGVFQGYTGGAWLGICDHKNTLGVSMAFLLTPALFTSSYGRGRKLIYSALLLFLIGMSQSRGAWLDTAGMLLFVAWLSTIRRVRARELAPILLVTAAVILAAIALASYFWPQLAAHMGKSASMSGRTGIYTEVWRSIMKRPMLGYGFGAFWDRGNFESQRIASAVRWPNIGYSENGFLEVALQTGFLGVGLILAMMVRAAYQGIRLLRSPRYVPRIGWFLTILFLVLLTNVDAGWFMTLNTLDWVLLLIACIHLNDLSTPNPKLRDPEAQLSRRYRLLAL